MGKAEIFPGAACRPYTQGAAGRIFLLAKDQSAVYR